jgi:hypothetical protein
VVDLLEALRQSAAGAPRRRGSRPRAAPARRKAG